MFSNEVLSLEIEGPETAVMGNQVTYKIRFKNSGNFVLENPKLTFQLPENSLTEDGKLLLTQTLDDIRPGHDGSAIITTNLAGKEGDLKVAGAWLSYNPHNLTARYESHATFTTKIDTVPITLVYDAPPDAERGEEMSYTLNYASDVNYPLERLSIKMDSVSGFSITKTQPFSLDSQEWKIASLQKGQGGKITITGQVAGDAPDSFTFSAKLGLWQSNNFVVLREASRTVQVKGEIMVPSPSPSPSLSPSPSPSPNGGIQIQL